MKVVYGALVIAAVIIGAFVGVKVLKSKEKKSCFDWDGDYLVREIKYCDDCKKNFTAKADLEDCYFGFETHKKREAIEKYQKAVLKGFTGDEATKAAIEKDLERCGSMQMIVREDARDIFRCEEESFAKHCQEGDEKLKEFAKNPGLDDCDAKD